VTDPTPLLTLERVNTFRGPAHVLRDVSLTIAERESVCLVGRNGAGKTTTIDTIMGLLSARSGTVRLNGQDITGLPTHRRALAGIGYSPEDAGIFPDLTVAENFRISQSLARAAGKTVPAAGDAIDERVLALFPEIGNFTERRGLFLSGGQKKMVAIGRAMTLSPKILLLDEPFEGLAPVVVTRFIDAVKRIKEMGISLLIAESNLMTASRVADRLYAIDRGEIIFDGAPRLAFEHADVMKTIRG